MSAPTAHQRWLFGAAPDLLLGCGLGYLLAFVAQAALGSALPALVPAGLLVLLTSVPHYGATLVRVYDSAVDRRKYVLFAVHGTLLIAVLFVLGLRSALLGSLILTLYLTWSPWHYTGQNYGISLMLMGRRGVQVTPTAKRLLRGSFVLSYVMTFLAIHGLERAGNYAPVTYEGTTYHLLSLDIPADLAGIGLVAAGLAYLVCLVGAAVLLLRAGSVRDVAPAGLLVFTQALWFSVPVVVKNWGLHEGSTALTSVYTAYGFIWIAAAHAVQYLWVTTYYARASRAETGNLRYLAKTVLAGYAVWTLPGLLFAPGLLGRLSYESGLALLVAATVNLHHFVLDGVIWRLRDGRVARFLVRSGEESASEPQPIEPRGSRLAEVLSALGSLAVGRAPGFLLPNAEAAGPARRRRVPLAPLMWAAGALAVGVSVATFLEQEFGVRRAQERHDVRRMQQSAARLAWLGREGPSIHLQIAQELARVGDRKAAIEAARRSLEVRPTLEAWRALAGLHEQVGDWPAASQAYEAALAFRPEDAALLYRAGLARLELGDAQQAVVLLERASHLAPRQQLIRLSLERARRESGGGADATEEPAQPRR